MYPGILGVGGPGPTPRIAGHAHDPRPRALADRVFSWLAGKSVIGVAGFPELYRTQGPGPTTPHREGTGHAHLRSPYPRKQGQRLKSSGPRTAQGRERSSHNSLKHGLTGAGVVVHDEDAAEVERRIEALQAELNPKSAMGAILVRQMATLSVRMERGARQEFAAIAARVRHAADDFDEDRIERAERLLERDRRRPAGQPPPAPEDARGGHPAGPSLAGPPGRPDPRAQAALDRLAPGEGRQPHRAPRGGRPGSRLGALSRAVWGDFEALADHEGRGLEDDARKAWARARLVERIDAEVAGLEVHLETLDFEMIELDRAEAGDRALFDPSKEAALARRYESEARRGFFQALKEFRQVEAEAAEREELAAGPAASPCQRPASGPVGFVSCGAVPTPSRGPSDTRPGRHAGRFDGIRGRPRARRPNPDHRTTRVGPGLSVRSGSNAVEVPVDGPSHAPRSREVGRLSLLESRRPVSGAGGRKAKGCQRRTSSGGLQSL